MMEDYISSKIKNFKTSETLKGRPATKEIFHLSSPVRVL